MINIAMNSEIIKRNRMLFRGGMGGEASGEKSSIE